MQGDFPEVPDDLEDLLAAAVDVECPAAPEDRQSPLTGKERRILALLVAVYKVCNVPGRGIAGG